MFEKLKKKLESLAKGREPFDPSRFGDPIAMQIEWKPLKGGGANFRTHTLAKAGFSRLEFRASMGAIAFYLVFLLTGMGMVIGYTVPRYLSGSFSFDMDTLMPSLIGIIFAIAGGVMLYFGTTPIVFDRGNGFFWKGRKTPNYVFDRNAIKVFAELREIHALQLIAEYCSGSDGSFYSYELNLVLGNGKRINVVDHGNKDKLREDAAMLAAFLEKPVWDAL